MGGGGENALLHPVLKMIQEENLGDANKFYLTLCEASSVCSQGSRELENGTEAGKLL